MRIAKGIKGIRKIINENKYGWHVIRMEKNGTYANDYVEDYFLNIIATNPGYVLESVTGNGLYIVAE